MFIARLLVVGVMFVLCGIVGYVYHLTGHWLFFSMCIGIPIATICTALLTIRLDMPNTWAVLASLCKRWSVAPVMS